MDILVFGQSASVAKAQAAGYAVARNKTDLFERSDVLSLHVRLRPETTGIVTAEDLARMKSTALLVNTARAELIAPGALLDALRKGRPGYAAVDVYEQEPIVNGDHPFLSMVNVLCPACIFRLGSMRLNVHKIARHVYLNPTLKAVEALPFARAETATHKCRSSRFR